jgi:hypothetical protein
MKWNPLFTVLGAMACLLAQTAVAAATATSTAGPTASLSQIGFIATLSISDARKKLRASADAAFRKSPPQAVSVERDGMRVTVTPTVHAKRLGLSATPDGTLRVSVPIGISVKVDKSFLTATVGVKGCEDETFTVSAEFDPKIESTGGLGFTLGDVGVKPSGYVCGLYWIWELEDVAAKIKRRLTMLGETAFKTRLREFNALLPKQAELLGMLKEPAEFGGAVTLGIDAPRLQIKRLSSKGDIYRVSGVVEGRPRLLFGDDWTVRKSVSDETVAGKGFRLPARLLFPTDTALLPDASLDKASGCLGSFRLHPVPERRDLAVLQRCGSDAGANVIWLSGANEQPPRKVRRFNRSMSNVLDEVVAWLDDPSLWRGVAGIAALRQEVAAFRKLLALFQAETTIPVDTRGKIRFFDLNMDLIGFWVDSEAMLADVMLTGQAQLDLKLSL